MPVSCSVPTCSEVRGKTEGIRFFKYPIKNKEQRELWTKAVNKFDKDGFQWQPGLESVVCSRHFVDNRPSSHEDDPNYVPTLNLSSPAKARSTQPTMENLRFKVSKGRVSLRETTHLNDLYSVRTENQPGGGQLWECLQCIMTFKEEGVLFEHLKRHTGFFSCARCKKVFSNQYLMAFHLVRPHEGDDLQWFCMICNLEYYDKAFFEQHIKLHFNIKPSVCPICKKIFEKQISFKKHVELAHKKPLHGSSQKTNGPPAQRSQGPESFSVMIERVDTPERIELRKQEKDQLAIFKHDDQSLVVRIISAFATKDLIIPVLPEELMHYVDEDHDGFGEGSDYTAVIPIVAFIEKKIKESGIATISITRPSEEEFRKGFIVKFSLPDSAKVEGRRFSKIPVVKIFRTDSDVTKASGEDSQGDDHFADITYFGLLKEDEFF